MVDIRLPIGILFSIFGVLLTLFGAFSDRAIYATHSLGIDINLIWGAALLCFGIVMLALAFLGRKSSQQRRQ